MMGNESDSGQWAAFRTINKSERAGKLQDGEKWIVNYTACGKSLFFKLWLLPRGGRVSTLLTVQKWAQ